MRTLIILILALITNLSFTQTKKDSIISEIKKLSTEILVNIRSEKKDPTRVYKFSEDWKSKIDFLQKETTNQEINTLKNTENTTLNLIAHIIDFKRNNNKKHILNSIGLLIKRNKNKYIFKGGYDTSSYITLKRYLLELITEDNAFFQPDFKITKNEINVIKNKIIIQEAN